MTTEEKFKEEFNFKFTTILSNAEEVDLIPNGKETAVDFSNLQQFIDLAT